MFFTTLLLWSAFFVASQLLTPAPKIEDARPASLNDFNFPTATEGRVIPLVWGTDKVKGPNVMWYGDLRVVPIVEKVKVSLFSSKSYVKGHKYYIGFQTGIAAGECALRKIWVGEELVWSGNQTTDGDISVSSKNAQGTFSFYTGSLTQSVDAYLGIHQTPTPAYKGISYGVFKGGYVGESTSIKPWTFEVTRITDGLSVGSPYNTINTWDTNPMNVAYEILTNTDWGYGYSDADINLTTLSTHAETLYSEGNGFSLTLAQAREAGDILKEIERQCDCRFRLDTTTGLFTCTLIRDGYSTSGLKVANNSTILELQDYSREAWEGTINHVRAQYQRRLNDYADGYAPAQDMANMQAQNRKVAATFNFPGVKDDDLANQLAWREIRAGSYPLAKARFKVNRTFWDCHVGEVILMTYTCGDFEVDEMPMRIIKFDVGNPEAPEIVIDVVQDVFTYSSPSFAAPDQSSWVAPDQDVTPIIAGEQVAFEAPYALSRRADYPNENRLWAGARSQGRQEDGINMITRQGVTNPAAGAFFNAGNLTGFMQVGTLQSDITPLTTQVDILTDLNITELVHLTTPALVGEELTNMIMVDNEFMSSAQITSITGGVAFNNTYHGMLDSAQQTHAAGSPVYFLCTGGGLTDIAYTLDYHVDLRLLPYRLPDAAVVSESDPGITEIEVDTNYRERRPYPPTIFTADSVQWPTSIDIDAGVTITFNRRDYRIYDELSQLSTDAGTINLDFPANNTTQYRLSIYDDLGAELWAGSWNAGTASLFVSLSDIVVAYSATGLCPDITIGIWTRHTYDTVVRESLYDLSHTATVVSELCDDTYLGEMDTGQTVGWTAPTTGTYGATVEFALDADLDVKVNGGAFTTLIASGNTAGSLVGVNATDLLEFRHTDSTTASPVVFRIDAPGTDVDAYAVLIFDNLYYLTGGFGRGGFGLDRFGR